MLLFCPIKLKTKTETYSVAALNGDLAVQKSNYSNHI